MNSENEIIKLKEEIEQLKEEKKGLQKIISHDIKSPFNRVFSLIHLIRMSEDTLDEEQRGYLDTMHLAIISGIDMIKNLNAIRELDQGDLNIEMEPVSINSIFQRLYRDFLLIAEMKGIELNIGNVLEEDYSISADAYYVERTIYQVVTNALKYCHKGENIDLSLIQKGGDIVFSCKDTGPGLKKEEQSKLFSKFSKCSNTPTGGEGQTGLGLYLVDTYQKAMNGKVEFKSGEEKGVTVNLIFNKA